MKKYIGLPALVFLIGFALGVFVFFPMEQMKYPIQNLVNATRVGDLELGRMSLGTGLGLGLGAGGLIAIHADNVSLTLNSGQIIECKEATISPRLLPLFMLRASVALRCKLSDEASIVATFSGFPFYKPSSGSLDVYLTKIPLDFVQNFAPVANLTGSVGGEAHISSLDLLRPPGQSAKVSWNITGEKVTLPPVLNDFLKLPSISLGPIATAGNYEKNKLVVDKLNFGDAKQPLEGQIKVNFGLDGSGMPVSGELNGNLRTDPVFEKNQLRGAVNLDLTFGKVKASGRREFKKPVRGGILSLMGAPVDN